jgi:hypothetical protein
MRGSRRNVFAGLLGTGLKGGILELVVLEA